VGKANLHCENPRIETKPLRMLVDFVHESGETEPPDITALSDGYRTHFSLVVDLARRMVQLNPSPDLDDPRRGTNTEAVVLIDEIDLHLDPSWQARVVQGLLDTFPHTQFILTTHSEQVVGSVEVESVRKLVWNDGEVVVEGVPFAQGATDRAQALSILGQRSPKARRTGATLVECARAFAPAHAHRRLCGQARAPLGVPRGDRPLPTARTCDRRHGRARRR
jgi:predicted ATP-binding protein involved in virulence